MVATGDDVHPGRKNFLGGLGRDARAAGGIFTVGDDKIHGMPRAQPRQKRLHGTASGLANNVTNEQNLHWYQNTPNGVKNTKTFYKSWKIFSLNSKTDHRSNYRGRQPEN